MGRFEYDIATARTGPPFFRWAYVVDVVDYGILYQQRTKLGYGYARTKEKAEKKAGKLVQRDLDIRASVRSRTVIGGE